jgi:hypothetical protein
MSSLCYKTIILLKKYFKRFKDLIAQSIYSDLGNDSPSWIEELELGIMNDFENHIQEELFKVHLLNQPLFNSDHLKWKISIIIIRFGLKIVDKLLIYTFCSKLFIQFDICLGWF